MQKMLNEKQDSPNPDIARIAGGLHEAWFARASHGDLRVGRSKLCIVVGFAKFLPHPHWCGFFMVFLGGGKFSNSTFNLSPWTLGEDEPHFDLRIFFQ